MYEISCDSERNPLAFGRVKLRPILFSKAFHQIYEFPGTYAIDVAEGATVKGSESYLAYPCID